MPCIHMGILYYIVVAVVVVVVVVVVVILDEYEIWYEYGF